MAGSGPSHRVGRHRGCGDGHHGAQRDVDAAGPDDEGQAERDDGHGHDLDELEPEVGIRQEVRVLGEVEDDERDDADVDAIVREPALPVDIPPGARRGRGAARHDRGSATDGSWPAQRRVRGGRASQELHDHVLVDVAAGELADDDAVAQDDEPIRALHDLLEVGADEDDGQTLAGEVAHERLDLGLGADVDAARRVVEDEEPRGGGQHAGQEHLLLVAARELGELLVGSRGLDAQPLDELLGDAPLVGADEQTAAGQSRQDRERDVVLDRERGDDALGLAVLGDEGDAGRDGGAGGAAPDLPALHRDRARIERLRAEDGLGRGRAPGAQEARQADDLAAVHRDIDVIDDVVPAEAPSGQRRPRGRRRRSPRRSS